jgi:acyl-coenzyme A thioesterase 13
MTRSLDDIGGNASDELKEILDPVTLYNGFRAGEPIFGHSITARLQLLEVSVVPMAEEPTRQEGRIVCSIDVTDGTAVPVFYSENT